MKTIPEAPGADSAKALDAAPASARRARSANATGAAPAHPPRGRRLLPLRRLLAGAGVAALIAAPLAALGQAAPQPKLPVVRLQAGMHIVLAEVAATPQSREIGLMMRERLGPNEGMLFVFEQTRA